MKLLNNKMGKKVLAICAVAFLSIGFSANAAEILKRDTVFVIKNMSNTGTGYPLGIFKVNGNMLTDINTTTVPTPRYSAVGLAISTKNKLLFTSHEGSGTVDVINAETGAALPDLVIPGTSDIAGIVVSESRNRLYVVDRDQPHVFVYKMQNDGNISRITSEEFDDQTPDGVWGIDVWGNRLYCTHGKYGPYSGNNNKTRISIYNLDTKSEVDHYDTTSATNQAIAVDGSDSNNVMVYTTWANQGTTASIVTQFNLNTREEKFINLGRDGRGLSVNPALGLVYAVTGDSSDSIPPVVRTYGENQFTAEPTSPTPFDEDNLTQGVDATDVVAVGVTFNPDVSIEITDPKDKNISMCNYATFTITVKNPSAEENLTIYGMEDNYDMNEMQFVSSSVTPDNATDDGNITWSNLNQTIAANGTWSFTKRFIAKSVVNAAHETMRITNAAFESGQPTAFENTIYFDIAYSTATCPTTTECCSPSLKNRGSSPAVGTLGSILFGLFVLFIGSTMMRRKGRKV